MHVITRKRLHVFGALHPDARGPLDVWYRLMRRGRFESPHVVREIFPAADFLGTGLVVFNIGGNKYRLVAQIHYATETFGGRVYVRHVMTHEQYDAWNEERRR